MKKRITACLLLCIIFAFAFSGCNYERNNVNEIPVHSVYFVESNGISYLVTNRYGLWIDIDFENKSFSFADEEIVDTSIEGDGKSFFFTSDWQPIIDIKGYEALGNYIQRCRLDNDRSIVDAHGALKDNVMVGFVRVYEKGIGPYVGNSSVVDVVHSHIYSYDPQGDGFVIEHTLDGVAIIAFEGDSVIYWKDRAFYLYDLNTKEEKYLIEHKSFDGGPSNWSTTDAYYDSECCIIWMRKGYSNYDEDFAYVYEWSTGELYELSLKE